MSSYPGSNDPYNPDFNQQNGAGQNNPQDPYGQQDPYSQPGAYGQPNQPDYGQQQGAASQPGAYGQPSQPSQPGAYGGQTPHSQPGGYGQPGAQQPGGYGQPGQQDPFAQPGPFGANAAYGQPAPQLLTADDYRAQGVPLPLSQPVYGVSMMEAYKRFWKKSFRFAGYASRSEFWWPALINSIIMLVPALLLFVIQIIVTFAAASASDPDAAGAVVGLTGIILFLLWGFIFLFSLATLIPTLSVGWRRLQDAGFPGALTFISFVASIVVYIMCALETKPEARRPEWEDTRGD